jgi:hypothetical protein
MKTPVHYRHLVAVTALILLLGGVLPACSPLSVLQSVASSMWGFPFQAGTKVTLGDLGLHDDNYRSVPGAHGTIYFQGYKTVNDASLDLLTADGSSAPVIPLAAGTVLSAWPQCHLVVVDHLNGFYVEYLHLNVAPGITAGKPVTRSTILGTPTTKIAQGNPCYEQFEGNHPVQHVHFAFILATSNTYQHMIGISLCGHQVKPSTPTLDAHEGGSIDGLASGPGKTFTIPDCTVGISNGTTTRGGMPILARVTWPRPTARREPVLAA